MEKLQAVRGMNDILPADMPYWQTVEMGVRSLMHDYGYHEIRVPVLESTALFKRSVGETTDIAEKEMYTFDDRNGDSLSLRPEGTACVVRAGIEHGLLYNQTQKLWYQGPMYRHERPQKGRYRQFYQFGVEVFGIASAHADVELMAMTYRLFKELGLEEQVTLQINSLGSQASRQRYREVLVAYFREHLDALDEDSVRRLDKNPLRILDSKNPAMQDVIAGAPRLADHYDDDSQQHFDAVQNLLNELEIPYEINDHLVRGLDYYCHTVFEWVTDTLGAQGTVCAGGRYDGLVEQLGGKATAGVGFAMGFERVILMMKTLLEPLAVVSPDIYVISVGDKARMAMLGIAEDLRDHTLASVAVDCQGGSFKSQMKRADKSGASYVLILGEEEIDTDRFSLKDLSTGEQMQYDWDQMSQFLDEQLMSQMEEM